MDYPHFSRQVLNTLRNIPNRCSFKCSPFHALFFKCCLHIGFRACLRHPQPQDCSCVIFYVIENVHLACNGASRYVSASLPKICPAFKPLFFSRNTPSFTFKRTLLGRCIINVPNQQSNPHSSFTQKDLHTCSFP